MAAVVTERKKIVAAVAVAVVLVVAVTVAVAVATEQMMLAKLLLMQCCY